MRYKGILFDLDGTLLDTSDLIIKSFQHAMQVHYQQEADIDIVRAYFGKPLRAALEVMGPDKVDELVDTYREYNLLHHDRLAKIFAGVVEAVQQLYSAGVLLGVVTSKTYATALRGLRLFDLDKYFPVVIGCERCTRHKPDPEPVLIGLAELGINAAECLMVGDSPFDIASARSAGVRTVAVGWSELPREVLLKEKPDYFVDSMAALLDVCGIKQKTQARNDNA